MGGESCNKPFCCVTYKLVLILTAIRHFEEKKTDEFAVNSVSQCSFVIFKQF